jgi:hypothetical protein
MASPKDRISPHAEGLPGPRENPDAVKYNLEKSRHDREMESFRQMKHSERIEALYKVLLEIRAK